MLQIKWDDYSKESHPGKPLYVHLKEVEEIYDRYSKFYRVKDQVNELMKEVIRYHDCGKLNPEWNVRNEQNPRHSEYSILYMEEKGLSKELRSKYGKYYYPFILYFILKHHSALYDITGSNIDELKKLCRDIVRRALEQIDFVDRIEMIDAFGIFKLADSLSASNKADQTPESPNITIDAVKNMLSEKHASLDEDRWREQLRLTSLSDISMLKAYTGWGKTDASVLFFLNKQVSKVFYLFPTITAINKFNEKLVRYFKGVEKYFYFYEYEMANRYGESQDEAQEFSISSFFASHFLYPIVLTTVDQFLLTFLQLGKYYMKRFMFRNAGIVIDEVHLLNPKILTLLLHFISKFHSVYGLKIMFMSATLSDALMQIVKDYLPKTEVMDLSEKYKTLHRVNYVIDSNKTVFEGTELILRNVEDRRILVVMNTVGSAVAIAKKLEDELKGRYRVLLLHGRFMYKDRIEKEKYLGQLMQEPHVTVTTQVCEVSLDASFDMLVTEMAPLPSIIQRFGRVNRYGTDTEGVNAYIYREYRKSSSQLYPYEDDDIDTSRKILDELYPIRNEYQLIERYSQVENYEKLRKRMDDAAKELDLEASWESDQRTGYFFSFKLDEEEARRRLLEFRDDITVSVLPHPDCVEGNASEELRELLAKWEKRKGLTDDQISKVLKEIRGYLVPVPIWLVSRYLSTREMGYPLFGFQDWIYSEKYGLIGREVDNII